MAASVCAEQVWRDGTQDPNRVISFSSLGKESGQLGGAGAALEHIWEKPQSFSSVTPAGLEPRDPESSLEESPTRCGLQ